ncbi:hypothetical protein FNV43_RR13739 [Rhamnella rubrinervis]|uniref:O-methyltransferase C-terminal domain-containing protein n=1 Tax=Rhamnella rubrinervis TaxID=2594499 RepID=A0A8K0MER0_9ROSA|nr:hypothetical protein FNV43_RR13739 [Rhamnella rubrinervis]
MDDMDYEMYSSRELLEAYVHSRVYYHSHIIKPLALRDYGQGHSRCLPHIKCAVLDLPHVIAGLQGTHNLDFLAGDMFEAIPPANAILLKWILHDWNDEECVRILKRCKEAIPGKGEGGKVMIIEIVIEEDQMDKNSYEAQLQLDMVMMVMHSGKERNQMEWEKIFLAAGFSDYKITPAFGDRSLIELYP